METDAVISCLLRFLGKVLRREEVEMKKISILNLIKQIF